MSFVKRRLESLSVALGGDGEITNKVKYYAQHLLDLRYRCVTTPLTDFLARPRQTQVEGIVSIAVADLINRTDFVRMLSMKLVGSEKLRDVRYFVRGVDPENNVLFFHVVGDVSAIHKRFAKPERKNRRMGNEWS